MTRSDVLKKYLPTEITRACAALSHKTRWEYLTDKTADKVAEWIDEHSVENTGKGQGI